MDWWCQVRNEYRLAYVPPDLQFGFTNFPSSFPDSTLYLAGGEFPDGSASREMWRYDPCFDSWTEMAPMNVARSELGEEVSTLFFSHRWIIIFYNILTF